ncbi:MAG: hypothetical protein ACRD4L_07430 [Pyrinomonadaceae bacterium]
MSQRIIVLLFLILTVPFAAVAQGGKVEAIGPLTDKSASQPVRTAIEAKGSRVTLTDGSVLGEIWMRSGLPVGAKTDGSSQVYSTLGVSTLVGVINFPNSVNDFRGQSIKAGVYTLRYALHPSDGNHLGISPIRDFLLLIPASVDQTPDAKYKFEELVKMSAKASGTNHPAVISLVQPDNKAGSVVLTQNEHGHLIFATKIKSQSGPEVPIAFIIKGVAEQ